MREIHRIDGTNDETFWRTYTVLNQSLAGEDLVQFQIAIQRVLCVCMENVKSSDPAQGNDPGQLQAEMQKIFNGLSFSEIVALGEEWAARDDTGQ
jgi:hypothetical protein